MKVQAVRTPAGDRWIILDARYQPVKLINRYLKFLDILGRAENTLLTYARRMKIYGDFLELRGIDLADIANQEEDGPLDILADFLLWMQYPAVIESKNITIFEESASKRKPKTVNAIMSTVLEFYDYLARDGIISPLEVYRESVSPVRFKSFLFEMIKKKHVMKKSLFHLPEEKENLQYVSPEVYRKMLSVCYCWRDKAIIGIMYEGGLRIGETLGLFLEDLEMWNSTINIVPREGNLNKTFVKRKAAGSVYLPNDVLEAVSAYFVHERSEYESRYLFLNLHGKNAGQPVKPDTVEKLFCRISRTIGIKVHPHMCRHGCATARLDAGWDELSIKNQLRHANLSSTRIYEHYKGEKLKEKNRILYESIQKKMGWSDDERNKQNS